MKYGIYPDISLDDLSYELFNVSYRTALGRDEWDEFYNEGNRVYLWRNGEWQLFNPETGGFGEEDEGCSVTQRLRWKVEDISKPDEEGIYFNY